MVGFLALIAIQIGVILLQRLLGPKVKRPKAAPFEAPNVEEGAPIPKVFGIQQISGTVILVADKKITMTHDDTRAEYRAKIAYGLCWGPIDYLYDIVFDERALSLQLPGRNQSAGGHFPITTAPFPINLTAVDSFKFDISALNMFGGGAEEGGVNGEVCIYRGTDAQPLDPLILYGYHDAVNGDFGSRFPHIAWIRFGTAPGEDTTNAQGDQFLWSVNNPQVKPVSVIVGCYPRRLVDLAASLGITGYTDPRVGQDANPIEVWFESLTNDIWGASEADSLFNIPNLIDAAKRCQAEGRGISTVLADRDLDDFLDDVMLHTRAVPYENAETGLLEVRLLRPDYVLADLVEVTEDNSENFHQGEGHFLETLNQIEVKYSKFDGGTPGDGSVTFDAKFLYNIIDWQAALYSTFGQLYRQTDGRNIINVAAERNRAGDILPLIQGVDFVFSASEGWFRFYSETGNVSSPLYGHLADGDVITITYQSQPSFSGFIDAVATAQNLANQQITGYTRAESYDYTMFTQRAIAQEMADFLRLLTSRKLAVLSWDMTRGGSHLNTGDVVVFNGYGLTNYLVRLTRVSYGPPSNPRIHCEGTQDVFAEQVAPLIPSQSEQNPPVIDLPPIEATVTLQCLGNSVRIGTFATDVSYNIEIIMADDADGSNAVIITPDGGIPGTSTFFDYSLTIGVTKYFRARLIHPLAGEGDMSPVISCTTNGDPPSIPTDVLPTWSLTQSQTDTAGTATLAVNDPQGRVTSVEGKSQAGLAMETDYAVLTDSYTMNVALSPPNLSHITFRISYVDLDGEIVSAEVTATFDPNEIVLPPPVETPTGNFGTVIIIPLHSTLTVGAVFPDLPGEWVPLSPHGMRRLDLSECNQWRVETHVKKPLPLDAKISVQYIPAVIENPSEEDWKFLDGSVDGDTTVRVDEETAIPKMSKWSSLALEARQEIVFRGVVMGGDGVTVLSIHESFVHFRAAMPADNGGQPPDETCQESTVNFNGYDSKVDMTDQDWVFTEGSGEVVLDLTGGKDGSKAIRIDLIATTFPSSNTAKLVIGGLTPGATYFISGDIKFSASNGAYAFAGLAGAFGFTDNFQSFFFTPGQPGLDYIGEFKTLTPGPSDVANGSGEVEIFLKMSTSGDVLNPFGEKLSMWVDNIKVTSAGGTLINPCMSGPGGDPNIPEDPNEPDCPGCPPPVLPPASSRRLTLWGYLPDVWGDYPPFNATHYLIPPNQLASVLAQARAANMRIVLVPFSTGTTVIGGTFSLTKAKQMISAYRNVVNWADWLDVLAGIEVMDEPNSIAHWGTKVQIAVLDGELAKLCSEVFPGVPLSSRISATDLEDSGRQLHYLQIATCHYAARFGSLSSYMSANRAAASRLGIGIAWGFNPANGGDGSSHIQGDRPGWWRMTTTEIRNMLPMAKDKNSYWMSVWLGTQPLPSWPKASDYVSAFSTLVTELNS